MQRQAATPGEGKLAEQVHEDRSDYHDPFDDWSARDLLLSLVPFIVVYAHKDNAGNTALAFAIAWSAALIIIRYVAYDARYKQTWPILDITSLITFAVLRGLTRNWAYWIHKWAPVIIPLDFAFVALLSILWRRPFTSHYAHYARFDRGGKGLWQSDPTFRRTADLTTLGFATAWSVMLLFSLIPILKGHWFDFNALNVIFNYVFPNIILTAAVVFHQEMGKWYRAQAGKAPDTGKAPEGVAMQPIGAGEPAGEV